MTVHNLAFQGLFGWDIFPQLRLDCRAALASAIEYYGGIGFLKAGLHCADRDDHGQPDLRAGDPTAAYGMGLEGLLQSRADVAPASSTASTTDEWDPGDRPGAAAALRRKHADLRAANKRALESASASSRRRAAVLRWSAG